MGCSLSVSGPRWDKEASEPFLESRDTSDRGLWLEDTLTALLSLGYPAL